MKHLKHTLATYVYSQCNICNIQMKHTSETHETYGCNIPDFCATQKYELFKFFLANV
jgi:hypothetical protein